MCWREGAVCSQRQYPNSDTGRPNASHAIPWALGIPRSLAVPLCDCTQFYEELKAGSQPAVASSSANAVDISDAIASEVAELKNPKSKLFSYHNVNIYGLIYVTLNSPDLHPTPSEMVVAAAKNVKASKQCLSK